MTSGSRRRKERKAIAKLKAWPLASLMSGLTGTCTMPSMLYSTGFSAVRILMSGRLT